MRSLLLVTMILLTGCSYVTNRTENTQEAPADSKDMAVVKVFDCVDPDLRFTAAFKQNELFLFLPKHTMRLDPSESDVTAWQNRDAVFRNTSPDTAILEMPLRIYDNCHVNRRETIWEAAKLTGVDYRAIGHEPGWVLELSQNLGWGKLVLNYGSDVIEGPIKVKADPENNRSEVFFRDNDEAPVIELSGFKCQDSMSDDTYSSQAVLSFKDRTLSGCGRALH